MRFPSLKRFLQTLGWILLGAVVGPLAIFFAGPGQDPGLQVWHRYRPMAEFHAGKQAASDLPQYLDLEERLPVPDRLIMLSPAFAVSKSAALARWVALASRLPGLEHLGWTSIQPEFDPYKYNSFSVHAGALIYRLTESARLALLKIRSMESSRPMAVCCPSAAST